MAQSIGAILQQLADFGIFFYVLPFLLVFALVFAILQKVKITGEGNKGIDAVIALTVSLMSLQFDAVPIFFQIIFPKVGIALSILLAAMLLLGLTLDIRKSRGMVFTFLGIGGVLGVIILLQSFQDYSWWTGSFWQENISAIVAGIILLVLVLVIINSGKSDPEGNHFFKPVPDTVR